MYLANASPFIFLNLRIQSFQFIFLHCVKPVWDIYIILKEDKLCPAQYVCHIF